VTGAKPLKLTTGKPRLHPDWHRRQPWFLPTVLIIFIAIPASISDSTPLSSC
jgi:hypothetical protein